MTTRSRSTGERARGPTLRDVAELAGLSLMTVSRALNGGTVSAENTTRVKRAADELGYVPNVSAQRMRGGRTKTVGVLMNIDFDPRTEFMTVLDCLIRELESAGNQVLLDIARTGRTQLDDHLRGFIARGVDGLFVWKAQASPLLERYARAGTPVIAMGFRDDDSEQLPMVALDAAPVFAKLYRRMTQLGHRNAVELSSPGSLVMHESFDSSGRLRWRRHDVGLDRAALVEFVEALRADPDPPTLVMGDYPRVVQLLGVCEEQGIDVPGDLSVISIVDAVGAPMLRTPLSCLRADYEALGMAAAKAMLAAIDGVAIADVIVPDSMQWIERASTGPAPPRRPRAAKRRRPVAAG